MVGTICPVGDRHRTTRRNGVAEAIFFLVGNAAGGALLGFAIGSVGSWVFAGRQRLWATAVMVAVVVAVTVLRDAGALRFRLSMFPRQVPARWWLRHDRRLAALLSGAHLGTGMATHVTCAVYYVIPALAFTHGALAGAVISGAYGFSRGAQPLFAIGLSASGVTSDRSLTLDHVR